MKPPHPEWIVPDWPAPSRVHGFITTRAGGVSTGPYAGLNLGLRTGDDPRAVAENRRRLIASLPQAPKWLRQVHGTAAAEADSLSAETEADAAIGRQPGTVCVVLIADCLPVLFTDHGGTFVAVAHAGWRGLASGILEKSIRQMPARADSILAYLGPAIGPRAFEVGADVRKAFNDSDPGSGAAFEPKGAGKWLADLFHLAQRQLERAGVRACYGGGLCTYSDRERFYSYRRDRTTGRMAAVIWRDG